MKRIRLYFIAASALACLAAAHIFEVSRGVHIKGISVDFGQAPPREGYYGPSDDGMDSNGWRPGTIYLMNDGASLEFGAGVNKRFADGKRELELARADEVAGRWGSALSHYQHLSKNGLADPSMLRERIELLELARAKNDFKSLSSFLAGETSDPPWIKPFERYSKLAKRPTGAERAEGFCKLAADFPYSPRAEPALMTAARDWLREDRSDEPKAPLAEHVASGERALRLLLGRYPKTRFRASALGWLARVDYLRGNYRGALDKYWRQTSMGVHGRPRLNLLNSIAECELLVGNRGRSAFANCILLDASIEPGEKALYGYRLAQRLSEFDVAAAKEFWKCLRASPHGLSNYLDYRLDHTKVTPDLLALARQVRKGGAYAGHIYGRLAEAAFRLHKLDACQRYARACLRVATNDHDLALATYLQASIAQRRGDSLGATALYERVVDRYRKGYVAQGARENLAILYERSNRLSKALDTYYSLGYEYDVAYMLDIRMSPEQIASYLRTRRAHPSTDAIRFALGIRYLRQHRFTLARQSLALVPAWKRKAYTIAPDWIAEDEGSMQDPMKTAMDLGHLYRAAAKAKGAKRAEGLLAIGNYYYSRRNLLLYNPRLWHWNRSTSIGFSWNDSVASIADEKALRRHHEDHECLAQAMRVFDQVVEAYPRTSYAQRAAYRGACAARRLSNFSPYWRWVADRGTLRWKAVNLMKKASIGVDKELGKQALKFAGVFAEDAAAGVGEEYKGGVPPRRWKPAY